MEDLRKFILKNNEVLKAQIKAVENIRDNKLIELKKNYSPELEDSIHKCTIEIEKAKKIVAKVENDNKDDNDSLLKKYNFIWS